MIRALLLALGAGAVVAACGSSEAGEASCAPYYEHGGATWELRSVQVTPVAGPAVGTIHVPPCDDVVGDGDDGGDGYDLAVAEVAGVSKEVALALPQRPDEILVRRGAAIPGALQRLFEPVACDPADPPQRLSGLWRGIGGAVDADDPAPPFDVGLRVQDATPERYRGARVEVRIPDDVDATAIQEAWASTLSADEWALTLEATCDAAGGYLATRVSGVERAS